MSVTGLCSICEAAPARHMCEHCGALVCDDHFDQRVGVCVNCARSMGRAPRER